MISKKMPKVRELCPLLIALWFLILMAYSSPSVQESIMFSFNNSDSFNVQEYNNLNTANAITTFVKVVNASNGEVGPCYAYKFTRDIGFNTFITAKELAGLNSILISNKIIDFALTSRRFTEDMSGYIVKYQQKYGINITGVIGKSTRERMEICESPLISHQIDVIKPSQNQKIDFSKGVLFVSWKQTTNSKTLSLLIRSDEKGNSYVYEDKIAGSSGFNELELNTDKLQKIPEGYYALRICDDNTLVINEKGNKVPLCGESYFIVGYSIRQNPYENPVSVCPVGYTCVPTGTNNPQVGDCPAGYSCTLTATKNPEPTSSKCVLLASEKLGIDSTGAEVIKLQQFLIGKKLLNVPNNFANGIYDEATRLAVIRYQKDVGLEATGVVDDLTIKRINKDYCDAQNPEVICPAGFICTGLNKFIEIKSCTTITESGNYKITNDIKASGNCIVVKADNVSIDGLISEKKVTITGNGQGYGIQATNIKNLKIRNIDVKNFSTGVFFFGVTESEIFKVESSENIIGFYVVYSLKNNFNSNIANSNTEHGFDIGFNSNNNEIGENTISNTKRNAGMVVFNSSNNIIEGNISKDNKNGAGIFISNSSKNNSLESNTVYGNKQGISIRSSSGNSFSANNSYDNTSADLNCEDTISKDNNYKDSNVFKTINTCY